MTQNEIKLLRSELARCSSYLEFGAGNSTRTAASCPNLRRVDVVESSRRYLEEHVTNDAGVKRAMADGRLHLQFIDLGEAFYWGYPRDTTRRHLWPTYSSQVFETIKQCDLILIDGRFRVACALNACLHLDSSTRILIHDFHDRPFYRVVTEFIEEIGGVNSFGLFRIRTSIDTEACRNLLAKYKFLPSDQPRWRGVLWHCGNRLLHLRRGKFSAAFRRVPRHA